jgi:hypothetical protein
VRYNTDWETCLPIGKRRRVAALQNRASFYLFVTISLPPCPAHEPESIPNWKPTSYEICGSWVQSAKFVWANSLPQAEGDGAHGVTRPTFSSGPLLHLFVVFAVRDFSDGYDELHRAGSALDLFPQLPG